jgi:hypothetical protein
MSDPDPFLTQAQVATFTGIRGGKAGKTREQRQDAALTTMRVPHYVNAAGRCLVALAVVEGGRSTPAQKVAKWSPGVMA